MKQCLVELDLIMFHDTGYLNDVAVNFQHSHFTFYSLLEYNIYNYYEEHVNINILLYGCLTIYIYRLTASFCLLLIYYMHHHLISVRK